MKKRMFLVGCVLWICGGLQAQQPGDLGGLIRPGTVIGGHRFDTGTTIDSIAFNNTGGIAFVARWREGGSTSTPYGVDTSAVFTANRVVARAGDEIGGKILVGFRSVAIDKEGFVSFRADWYEAKGSTTAVDPTLSPETVFAEGPLGIPSILTSSNTTPVPPTTNVLIPYNSYPKVQPITAAKPSSTCTTSRTPATNKTQNFPRLPPWAHRQLEAAGVSVGQSNSTANDTQPCSPAAGTNPVTK